MTTLLLRLSGPMQSWGTNSRFDERMTDHVPSKSGVIGLLCAALGRDRSESIDDLVTMPMAIRIDKEGILSSDFHTVTGVYIAGGKSQPNRTVIGHRWYIADGCFLVGFESENITLLDRIQEALHAPRWPLFLGRKSFPPSEPVALEDGIRTGTLREVLPAYPLLPGCGSMGHRRFIFESEGVGGMRLDSPSGPFSERTFAPRYITVEEHDVAS